MNFKFKENNPSREKRLAENLKIREKYPDKIPIICERHPYSLLPEFMKTKYLVSNDITFSQFSSLIKKRLGFNPNASLYLLVSGKHSILGNFELNEIYRKYRDSEDGFLYIYYTNSISV